MDFIEAALEEMPFPILRSQIDRGTESFAVKVQKRLKQYGIKFRPNKPGSPHLNSKVECSLKTDKNEFYSTVDLDTEDLAGQLAEWQQYYNWGRLHSAHNGNSPMDSYFELSGKTPLWKDVHKTMPMNHTSKKPLITNIKGFLFSNDKKFTANNQYRNIYHIVINRYLLLQNRHQLYLRP